MDLSLALTNWMIIIWGGEEFFIYIIFESDKAKGMEVK